MDHHTHCADPDLPKYVDDSLTCTQTYGRGPANTPLTFKGDRLCTPFISDYTPTDIPGMTPWTLDKELSEWSCKRAGQKTEQLMNGVRYFVTPTERVGYVRIHFVSRQPFFDAACLVHREGTDIKRYLTDYLLRRVGVYPTLIHY